MAPTNKRLFGEFEGYKDLRDTSLPGIPIPESRGGSKGSKVRASN